MTSTTGTLTPPLPPFLRSLTQQFGERFSAWRAARREGAELAALSPRERHELDVTLGNLIASGHHGG
ncbi:hypothetical protein [Arenibaculum pallidiluteum]|uniref:hypothetical protein n=1 Tax=Arenibaculum pallidiluteum TaxID=2812559 RepID=UPI001A974E1F|nr:hypothetical protein [Arenibaculum pallidiluteum]